MARHMGGNPKPHSSQYKSDWPTPHLGMNIKKR